jgi:hypothetical protein
MNFKIKILVAVAPILIGVTVGATMAYPAYQDYTAKQQQVEEKKTEEEGLATKLAGKSKLMKDKKLMEEALEKLRSSIPKEAEMELLNIDLERMCDESGVDLVSLRDADKEDFKKAGMEEMPTEQTSAQLLKNKIKGGAKTAGAASAQTGAGAASTGTGGAAAKGNAAASAAPDTGLQKISLAVRCIGDYPSLMALVRKLETYQRVVAITSLKTSVPKKETNKETKGKGKIELPDDAPPTENDEQGDYHRLNISFLLTAYYLP